jgi:hypothetical protein
MMTELVVRTGVCGQGLFSKIDKYFDLFSYALKRLGFFATTRHRKIAMIGLRMLAVGLSMLPWAAMPVCAAGAPPIGAWVSARGAQLVVSDDATCAFVVPTSRAEGECTWRVSDTGGILVIRFTAPPPAGAPPGAGPRPAVVYLDIRWINQVTIAVTGEIFRRTGW